MEKLKKYDLFSEISELIDHLTSFYEVNNCKILIEIKENEFFNKIEENEENN